MSRTLFFSLISSRPELTYYEGEESPRILEILDALEQAENYKLFRPSTETVLEIYYKKISSSFKENFVKAEVV